MTANKSWMSTVSSVVTSAVHVSGEAGHAPQSPITITKVDDVYLAARIDIASAHHAGMDWRQGF